LQFNIGEIWVGLTPIRVVIALTWRDKKSWVTWKNSPDRLDRKKDFEPYLDGEINFERFDLGMYPY
jgi:hypothetical protein